MNHDLGSDEGHANFLADIQQSLRAPSVGASQPQAAPPQIGSSGGMVATSIGGVSTTSEIGVCNLCELIKPLTEDHVPPKSCQLDEYNKKHWIHYALDPSATPRYSQGKVKFKTLCGGCNSKLGLEVDDELKNLIFFLRKCRSENANRAWAHLNTRKIAVSVLAHLQAQMVAFDPNNKSSFSSAVITLFRDLGASGLRGWKIYYTVDQNHEGYTVMNEAALSYVEKGKRRNPAFSCLKMPEICFYVTMENSFMGLPRLPIKERQLFEFKRMAKKWVGKAMASPSFPEDGSAEDVMLMVGINGMKSTVARKTSQVKPGPVEVDDPEIIALGKKMGIKFMVWRD